MRLVSVAVALAATLWGGQAFAQATTYTFTSPTYGTTTNAGACVVGECTTYTAAQNARASFTFAAPLAPNLPNVDRTAAITAYSFSDGVRTTTGPGPLATTFRVQFGTDATGLPTGFLVQLERTPGPPYTSSAAADPNSYVSAINFTPGTTTVLGNALCTLRAAGFGAVSGPGSCAIVAVNGNTSQASAGGPTVSVVTPVPTLSEWAMILLALTLAGGAILIVHRRRPTV